MTEIIEQQMLLVQVHQETYDLKAKPRTGIPQSTDGESPPQMHICYSTAQYTQEHQAHQMSDYATWCIVYSFICHVLIAVLFSDF